ncbi:MAG: GntR family transcriptional regulator [Candidatus Methanomethyliaceae archaeon]
MADGVYERLRELITNLVLKPGQRISVEDVAHMLEVSATPVREALHRLVEEGFVEQKPYIGFFVTNLTPEDVEELFEIRKTLETLAIQRLLLAEETRLAIVCLLKKLEGIKSAGFPYKDTQIFDEEFHIKFLLQSSNGRWLTRIARNVIDLIRMTTKMSQNPRAAHDEHYRILIELQNNNKPGAIEALLIHLDRAKQETTASFMEGGDMPS